MSETKVLFEWRDGERKAVGIEVDLIDEEIIEEKPKLSFHELWRKKVKEDWSDAKFKKELIKQGIIIKKRTNKDT